MPWARAAAVEKGMWEPGSGFEILVGLDMGCNKPQTDKGDSRNFVLSNSYNGLNHKLVGERPWKKRVRMWCAGTEERVWIWLLPENAPWTLPGKTKEAQGEGMAVVCKKIWNCAEDSFLISNTWHDRKHCEKKHGDPCLWDRKWFWWIRLWAGNGSFASIWPEDEIWFLKSVQVTLKFFNK